MPQKEIPPEVRKVVDQYFSSYIAGTINIRVVADKHGVDYDKLRRALYLAKGKIDTVPVEGTEPAEIKTSTEIFKSEISGLRKQLNEQIKHSADLQQQNEALIATLPKIPPIVPWKKPPSRSKRAKIEMVLQVSDWHGAEVVDRDEMDGLNEFNFDILCNRAWMLSDKIIEMAEEKRSTCDLDTLNISCLGDMVTGEIHEELARTNDISVLPAAVCVGQVLGQMIGRMSGHFKKIKTTCVPGNHGRLTHRPRYKGRTDTNWDTLVHFIASLTLENQIKSGSVEFSIPKAFTAVVERLGWWTLLEHGDEYISALGTPYYAMDRSAGKHHNMRRRIMGNPTAPIMQTHDIREIAHFHSPAVLRGPTFLNGALIGANEFSKGKMQEVTASAQCAYFLDQKHGHFGWTPLWLSTAREHHWSINPNLPYETL